MTQILVVPRWAGQASDDWYPWLQQQHSDTEIVALVERTAPPIEPNVQALLAALRNPKDTILVGHSVGCQVVMRALARLDARVKGALLVAGWWSVAQPWPTILPWQEPFDYQRTKNAAHRLRVVLSDNDPYTPDFVATRRLFQQRLNAEVTVEPGGKHFNGAVEPAVWRALEQLL